MKLARWFLAGLASTALVACSQLPEAPSPWLGSAPPAFEGELPDHFPVPRIPAGNPQTHAKAELGRRLFYDTRLSGNQTYSCASCHQQRLAFSDGLQRAVGATGETHPRNSMALINVAYNVGFTWADPRSRSLEEQALVPMLNQTPIEMGVAGRIDEILGRLRADQRYLRWFEGAFPDSSGAITLANVARALASFERMLISADSPYDRYAYGDDAEAISEEARRGMAIFFSDRGGCFRCHRGFNFSGPVTYHQSDTEEPVFLNTGLYDLGLGRYPEENTGLYEHTGRRRDMGRFRIPTLRNVELTGPYMHDGSIDSLEEVVRHYAAGGRTIESGPLRGKGSGNRHRSRLLRPLDLSEAEIYDLVAFMQSLTDHQFVSDPRLANPWVAGTESDNDPPAASR